MKDTVGLIFPALLTVFGAYALLTAFGSSGEQVVLFSDHALPRGFAIIFGLLGFVGGLVIIATSLLGKKQTITPSE